jgi:hypothetical protein
MYLLNDGGFSNFSDEILPHYVGQKDITGLKREIGSLSLICQANSPIFPNFFLQLVTSDFSGLPEKSSFQREKKTSLKPDVKSNFFFC